MKHFVAIMAGFAAAFLGLWIVIAIQHAIQGGSDPVVARLSAGAAFVVAYAGTYSYLDKRGKKEARLRDPNASTITKEDYKNFQKVLATLDCRRMGITEFRAIERMDGVAGFFIGLRTGKGKIADTDLLRQALYAVFRAQNSFEFVDLESENGKKWFANSVQVRLPEIKVG